MFDKITGAFEQIHAGNSLVEKTKSYVHDSTNGYSKLKRKPSNKTVPLLACVMCLALIIGGYFSYVTPVAAISIDINPSLELQVNLYNRIVSVEAFNIDGIDLSGELNIKNLYYVDAINAILENKSVSELISSGELMEVTVACASQNHAEKMRECISDQTSISSGHIYCFNNSSAVEAAHSAGISFGKYRAYLELCEHDSSITIEDISGMTMREIRDLLASHSSAHTNSDAESGGHGGKNGRDCH